MPGSIGIVDEVDAMTLARAQDDHVAPGGPADRIEDNQALIAAAWPELGASALHEIDEAA